VWAGDSSLPAHSETENRRHAETTATISAKQIRIAFFFIESIP
jgi:hypothetical protein